ncbi:MAG TPA: hypothetical protein VGA02_11750 [Gemmatimonadales bacterium]
MSDDRHVADDVVRRLSGVVQGEAHRMLSEAQRAPDPVRVADGWERRFITDGTRLAEVVALYQAAGFDVCADPIRREEFPDDCDDCQLLGLLRFRTIYTRRPAAGRHDIEADGPEAHL